MTDDQKSMATRCEYVHADCQTDDDDHQSEDDLLSQSEDEILSPEETPPRSPLSPPPEGDISFETTASSHEEVDTSCEMTLEPFSPGEDSCHDLCPNCLQSAQHRRMSPPGLLAPNEELFVQAKLKIFKATEELRSRDQRSGKRKSRARENFQRSAGDGSAPSSGGKSLRESMRNLVRRRLSSDRKSRERSQPQKNSIFFASQQ